MNEIEYGFGTGDGAVEVWSTQADLALTGTPDAVRLDFDGDGLIDDAMWDTQGDGVADVSALDLNDDGVLDAFFTDPSGHGVWDHQITGSTTDAASEPLDWIVRGAAPDASGELPSPIGEVAAEPVPSADPMAGYGSAQDASVAAQPTSTEYRQPVPAPQPPMLLTGPLAAQPAPSQPVPPPDPPARPDVQPDNPATVVLPIDWRCR